MERIFYWDNAKGLLIFLVVLGHFMREMSTQSGPAFETAYYFIYLFHMPAFVFVSGLFSKSYVRRFWGGDHLSAIKTLFGYLILFIAFKLLLWALASLLKQQFVDLDLLNCNGIPWYLFCLFLWHLLLPIISKFQFRIVISVSVVISLLVSLDSSVGTYFSLSRFFAFFPFFLCGYYLNIEAIPETISSKKKALAVTVLFSVLILLYCNLDLVRCYHSVLFGTKSYVITIGSANAIAMRIVWYIAAVVAGLSFMFLISKRKGIFSQIGTNTLGIYIFHVIVRNLWVYFGLSNCFENAIELSMALFLVSLVCCLVFSRSIFNRLLRLPFSIPYQRVMKEIS